MNITPSKKYLFLKFPEETEEDHKTESGIIISKEEKDALKTYKAEVLAVGMEIDWIEPGDIVLYKEYGPESIIIEGEKVLWAKEEDILGVFEELDYSEGKSDN